MAIAVDLNCDMGESFGPYRLGDDERMMPLITSANVACGFHAGDPRVMARTVQEAARHGVGVGAHVSYPDLPGFGRRVLHAAPEEIRTDVLYQIGALDAFCRAAGVRLQHVKPHGALYNVALRDARVAEAIAAAVAEFDRSLIVLAIAGSELARAAARKGLAVAFEGFADRHYLPDGTLVPRTHPQAVIHDPAEAARRVVRMVTEGRTTALDGTEISVRIDSLCVHGDTPEAVSLAKAVRDALTAAGVKLAPLASLRS